MLNLKNITKIYKTSSLEQKALDDVSINFRKNEFVFILGESGSGKSTLLNVIGGLDNMYEGDLIINGKNTKHFKNEDYDSYRNNLVGFVFQNYNLIDHLNILENVELTLSLSNVPHKERKKLVLASLSKVGLQKHAHKKPSELSGGEKQRVAIARAIVNNPKIITLDDNNKLNTYQNINYVIPRKSDNDDIIKYNNISNDYINYIEKINKDYTYGINYVKNPNINFIYKDKNDKLFLTDNNSLSIKCIPKTTSNSNFIGIYYDVLKGRLPNNKSEIVLEVDSYNKVDSNLLELLGLDFSSNVSFEDIMNSNINIVFNDDLYIRNNDYWSKSTNLEKLYDKSYSLKVVGIIRMKNIYPSIITSSSILYTPEFINYLLDINNSSNIIKDQGKKDFNVLNGNIFKNKEEKDKALEYLGKNNSFSSITIYPKNFNSKEKIIKYLDKYNENKKDIDKISYTDESKLISVMTSSIIESITIVLIFFSSISLIVSSIMIGIVTYISVLERTKEIGILRSLGARKKDISRVFNAENFIIGISSGILGIIITKLLIIPVNIIIKNLTSLSNLAFLSFNHVILLIIISLFITLLGGFIPSKTSSNKNIIDSLRQE